MKGRLWIWGCCAAIHPKQLQREKYQVYNFCKRLNWIVFKNNWYGQGFNFHSDTNVVFLKKKVEIPPPPSTVPFENDNRKYILLIDGPTKKIKGISNLGNGPPFTPFCGPPTCFLQRPRYWLQRQFRRFLCSKSRVWFPQEWQVFVSNKSHQLTF